MLLFLRDHPGGWHYDSAEQGIHFDDATLDGKFKEMQQELSQDIERERSAPRY